MRRRAWLTGMGAAASLCVCRGASALGRTPLGGRLLLHLPWSTATLDPHDLRDGTAALLAGAIADPVFALDAVGNPFPALAQALPTREGNKTVVRLREGLRTGRQLPIDGKDLLATVERARSRGAQALLAEVPPGEPHPSDPLAALFGAISPARLAAILSSPLVALLPRKFNPAAPDGTGAFRADLSATKLVLTRNPLAARGPSFLDAIEIERADDLKTSLRAFETESDDVGWLGTGLFDGRKGAVRFDLGKVAWIVLTAGPEAGSFGQPGVIQQICDAIPNERVAHLGLGALPRPSGDPGWGGPPTELLVDDSSPHLVEVARSVASIVTRPGHEVSPTPIARSELGKRRRAGRAMLALDVVRPLGPGVLNALVSLATADDSTRARDIVAHPPKFGPNASPRTVTSTLRLGVLGEVRVSGGTLADVVLTRSQADGWDLGASYRRPKR